MVTSLSYSMTRNDDVYVAECEELAVRASGPSPLDALGALRVAIEERFSDWYTLKRDLPGHPVRRVA
jgi:hypothetical protein